MAELRPSQVIPGVTHVEMQVHPDERGFFVETFRQTWFPDSHFVQGNLSSSRRGVLRGLHYHLRQEDLWWITSGRAYVALVDLRADSPAYRKSETFELGEGLGVHIPPGVAHGFYALTDLMMTYLVTNYYDGSDELEVAWDDPDLAIPWPTDDPILSARDRTTPRWADVPAELRPGGN